MDNDGNPLNGGGGFSNPARTDLDMNFNNINNVKTLNINAQYDLPSYQPSSPNDTNVYNLVSRGALVNIGTTGIFRVNLSRAVGPSGTNVDTTINAGMYNYIDLCEIIKDNINTWFDDNLITQLRVGSCTWTINRFNFIITNSNPTSPGPWGPVYTLKYAFSGSIAQYFGYNEDNTTFWNITNQAQTTKDLFSAVDWVINSNPATPISNGSPFVYSISEGKWYISDMYYTPNFLNSLDFNNAGYSLVQSGFNKLTISETNGTELWGIGGSQGVLLNANGVTLRLNAINRLRIDSNNLNIYSASLLNYLNINNSSISFSLNIQRFLIDGSYIGMFSPNTFSSFSLDNISAVTRILSTDRLVMNMTYSALSSPNDTGILNITNSDISMTQGGFTKFSMNEDPVIGTTLWGPSGSGHIRLLNAGITLRQNSVNRFNINNVETFIYSPSLLNNFNITDSAIFLNYNSAPRFSISPTDTYLAAPAGATIININDSSLFCSIAGTNRIYIDEVVATTIRGPVGYGAISQIVLTPAECSIGLSGGFNHTCSPTYFRIRYAPSLVDRFIIDTTDINIKSSNNTSLINLNDNQIDMRLLGNSRLLIDSTKTRTVSPNNNNYINIDNDGLTYTDAGINRLSISDTTTYIAAPSSSTYCSVSNTGCALTVDALNRFTAASGGNTTIKSFDNTTTVILAGDNFTATTTTNTLLLNADFNYSKGAQLRIHADSSHSQLLSPNGTQAVEANNSGVQINLGANNFIMPTTRGTAGQVITASGVAGTPSTWATPSVTPGSSINAGWGFLPMSMITATATAATRSFYYISMVPINTVITGIKAYINAAGADFINCAIYRGKNLVVGSPLVMTSGRVTVLSTLDANNYMTLPLTLQAGQSATFTAGEYVTIAYHSSGSGAVYYICPASTANLGISYISTACYAASGTPTFPANLSLITPSTTNTIRTHFEFY